MNRLKMSKISSFIGVLGFITTFAVQVSTLPPACESNVYCQGPLLKTIQLAKVYKDSKTFVDLRMLQSENKTLEAYDRFIQNNSNPTKEQVAKFINDHFVEGQELMRWTPSDFNASPPLLDEITDENFKYFAKELIAIWPELSRKVSPEVAENPDQYSLISLPNGFIIPGGRFKEIYYWDSFWIIEGIILSGMKDTARGMVENLLYLVKKFGHVPNGSRVYYQERSQPPLLTAMAAKYIDASNDLPWLNKHINTLEEELEYWLANRTVEVTKDEKKYVLLRYNAPSAGPRPESYSEDYELAKNLNDKDKEEYYTEIKSAAESGWDFSARWFTLPNGTLGGDLTHIQTRRVIPVDLNSMFAAAMETLGDLNSKLNRRSASVKWWGAAALWREAIDAVLWNEEDGIWYDYDLKTSKPRKHFYPSNVAPLWANCIESDRFAQIVPKVISYLKAAPALRYPGGVPTSLDHTNEQWDYPNAWPPLQSILIKALYTTGDPEGMEMAKSLAQTWVRANYKGYKNHDAMYEKYDAVKPGDYGGGGEYVVQSGFGWTNGVILELLSLFGKEIKSEDVSE